VATDQSYLFPAAVNSQPNWQVWSPSRSGADVVSLPSDAMLDSRIKAAPWFSQLIWVSAGPPSVGPQLPHSNVENLTGEEDAGDEMLSSDIS
jgi:hypothetical protein